MRPLHAGFAAWGWRERAGWWRATCNPDALASRGLRSIRPGVAERDVMNRIIMDELVCGVFKPESVAWFQRVIGCMKDTGVRCRRARLARKFR